MEKKAILLQLEQDRKKFKEIFNNKIKEQLYKWLKTELAYTSNQIEGNTLTRKETRLIIEDKMTLSSKPIVHYLEAINHAKAFDFVIDVIKTKKQVDEKTILKIHKILLSSIDDYNAGFYRHCPVRISGSTVVLPNALKVPDLMKNIYSKIKDINNVEDIIKIHLDFVSVHPFTDGNGRCARLLMNLLLMQKGICPIIIRPRDRKKYINSIEKAQLSGDENEYINFMLRRLKGSYETIFDIYDLEKEIPKEKLMTIAKFAKAANIPVSTIRSWVKRGVFKPIMYTESGYMMFSNDQIEKAIKIKSRD